MKVVHTKTFRNFTKPLLMHQLSKWILYLAKNPVLRRVTNTYVTFFQKGVLSTRNTPSTTIRFIIIYYLHRISLHTRCGLKLSFISHLNNTFFVIVYVYPITNPYLHPKHSGNFFIVFIEIIRRF